MGSRDSLRLSRCSGGGSRSLAGDRCQVKAEVPGHGDISVEISDLVC